MAIFILYITLNYSLHIVRCQEIAQNHSQVPYMQFVIHLLNVGEKADHWPGFQYYPCQQDLIEVSDTVFFTLTLLEFNCSLS